MDGIMFHKVLAALVQRAFVDNPRVCDCNFAYLPVEGLLETSLDLTEAKATS